MKKTQQQYKKDLREQCLHINKLSKSIISNQDLALYLMGNGCLKIAERLEGVNIEIACEVSRLESVYRESVESWAQKSPLK